MTTGGHEGLSPIGESEARIIELTQGFRDLAKDDVDARVGQLYAQIVGNTSIMSSHKQAVFQDRQNVLSSYQVVEPIRDLLLEDNPNGVLEVDIAPPHPKFMMSVRNPQTNTWVMIGALVRPYACPFVPSNLTPRSENSREGRSI